MIQESEVLGETQYSTEVGGGFHSWPSRRGIIVRESPAHPCGASPVPLTAAWPRDLFQPIEYRHRKQSLLLGESHCKVLHSSFPSSASLGSQNEDCSL